MWVVVVVVVAPILSLCVQENGEWGVKRGDRAVFPPSPLKIFPFKNIFQDLHFRRWTADRVGQVAPSVLTKLFPTNFFCKRKLFLLHKFENWLDHPPHRHPLTSFVSSPSLILICAKNQVHLQVYAECEYYTMVHTYLWLRLYYVAGAVECQHTSQVEASLHFCIFSTICPQGTTCSSHPGKLVIFLTLVYFSPVWQWQQLLLLLEEKAQKV